MLGCCVLGCCVLGCWVAAYCELCCCAGVLLVCCCCAAVRLDYGWSTLFFSFFFPQSLAHIKWLPAAKDTRTDFFNKNSFCHRFLCPRSSLRCCRRCTSGCTPGWPAPSSVVLSASADFRPPPPSPSFPLKARSWRCVGRKGAPGCIRLLTPDD